MMRWQDGGESSLTEPRQVSEEVHPQIATCFHRGSPKNEPGQGTACISSHSSLRLGQNES